MLQLDSLIHFGTIAFSICINSLGASIGEGIAGYAAIKASNRQPQAHGDIMRVTLIGIALIETTAILGIFISSMLLLAAKTGYYQNIAEAGIACAMCLSGLTVGIVSAFPVQEAVEATARQPFFVQKIVGFLIITQALVQTPVIAGFIISLLIQGQLNFTHCLADAVRLIASGLCIGLGSIGPSIGLALFAKTACRTIGIHRELYRPLLAFTLISQTLIETPVIFSFLISLMILFFIHPLESHQSLASIAVLAAALSAGLGTFGTAIGSSNTASAACKAIALNAELQSTISRTSLFAQALIETCTIYAILLSIALLFIARSM